MKFLAHDSDRYGYLSFNGVALPPEHIASRCGIPLVQYTTLLAELDAFEVPSRTPIGIIYCAELLAQAKSRKANKERVKRHRRCNASVTPPVMRATEDEDEKEDTPTLKGESEGGQELKYHKDARSVLFYLREATGRVFQENDTNLALISARLRDCKGTFEDTKAMIDRQCKRWKGTDQEEYLRPETLFGKTKFDGYYAARNLPVNANHIGNNNQRVDRNIGTLNEGNHTKYAGLKCSLGEAVGSPDVGRPAA